MAVFDRPPSGAGGRATAAGRRRQGGGGRAATSSSGVDDRYCNDGTDGVHMQTGIEMKTLPSGRKRYVVSGSHGKG